MKNQFLKLTKIGGQKIIINMISVNLIYDAEDYTEIILTIGTEKVSILVNEEPDEILNMLMELK